MRKIKNECLGTSTLPVLYHFTSRSVYFSLETTSAMQKSGGYSLFSIEALIGSSDGHETRVDGSRGLSWDSQVYVPRGSSSPGTATACCHQGDLTNSTIELVAGLASEKVFYSGAGHDGRGIIGRDYGQMIAYTHALSLLQQRTNSSLTFNQSSSFDLLNAASCSLQSVLGCATSSACVTPTVGPDHLHAFNVYNPLQHRQSQQFGGDRLNKLHHGLLHRTVVGYSGSPAGVSSRPRYACRQAVGKLRTRSIDNHSICADITHTPTSHVLSSNRPSILSLHPTGEFLLTSAFVYLLTF